MTRIGTSRAARRRKAKQQARDAKFSVESLETRILLAADVVGLSPADDATDVPVDAILGTSWVDPIRIGPGAGNILIHNVDDNSLIEAINVRSDQVAIDGQDVTITPSQDLPANTNISIRVDPAKYRDLSTEVTTQTIFTEDFESLPLQNSSLDSPLDNYALTMTGTLDVTVAGDYTFGINSDDGQELAVDVEQDGLDLIDDELIFDNNTHGREDRLSTSAFEDNDALQTCEGDGDDAITLAVGQYEFLYIYFEAGGGSGGEFFYGPGKLEAWDASAFALVGDDSKGIGLVDGVTVTTFKAPDGETVGDLETAEGLIEDDSLIIGTENYDLADVAENPGGRFSVDNAIPGATQWALDNDPSVENWTDEGPFDWTRDNSDLIEGGAPEYNGWTFMNKDFWITQQGNQDRTDYELGVGTVALVDPDAHDDFIGNGPHDNTACLQILEFGPECGLFTASTSTPVIYLDGVSANTATLEFDSSWWDEDTQSAETRVEYFDADGNSLGENVLLRWESMPDSENFKPQMQDDINTRNEEVEVALDNPAEAASMVITFDMPYASNDWWWAIDNIEVTADVEGVVSAGISDDTTWNFTTGEGAPVEVGPPIDVSTGTAAQSSQASGFVPENALDDVVNFTHTDAGDANPTWQVLLSDSYAFDSVTVYNRGASEGTLSCCPSRLRDITIQIVAFDGDVATDFTGGEIVASSDLLNPENVLGGGAGINDGPISLTANPGGAVGNLIRIIRTVDDDLSGTGGEGNDDEGSVLSIDLVAATGTVDGDSDLPADIDENGEVGFSDFLILSDNFGDEVEPGTNGDIDGNGVVEFADFLILSDTFGDTAEAAIDAVFAVE